MFREELHHRVKSYRRRRRRGEKGGKRVLEGGRNKLESSKLV